MKKSNSAGPRRFRFTLVPKPPAKSSAKSLGLFLLSACFLLLFQALPAANRTAQLPGGTFQTLPQGDFESPVVVDTRDYVYRPTGGLWTFFGGSGYSKDGTAFTIGNPAAPSGQQVLFLQGTGRVTQSIDFMQGYYSFDLMAAQRGNHQASSQTFELRIDGATVHSFTPAGSNYEQMTTGPILLSSGAHSIELRGINPNGGDNTCFIDLFRSMRHISLPIPGGDMEDPLVTATSGYIYRPAGGPWTFYSGAGLTKNNTAFTRANPNAPQGQQVMFLQNNGRATMNLHISMAASYRIRLQAALRGNNNPATEEQSVLLTVDGTVLGSFDIEDFNYVEYISMPIYLAAGNYSLEVKGLAPIGSDNTAFLDDLQLEMVADWQDAYAWDGGVPTTNDNATVPSGATVAMRGSMNAHNVTVNGELLAAQNQDFDFTSKNILVMGANAILECGREGASYDQEGSFTLTATSNDPEIMFMGNKFIAAMSGATLNLHGTPRVDWTQLDGTISPGATSIVLAEAVDWEVGDSIVIAPTDLDPHEAEAHIITSVSGNGKTIGIGAGIAHTHYGEIETYSNATRSWDLDMRAEVGLLSRNIKIQGDAISVDDGFGAHVMVMNSAFGYVEGVEFFLCGQKAILARYPFHWHIALDVTGQYLKHSSVHRSFNRVVTVHGSQNATVEGVVGFDHIGHGFFLETADETGNLFKDNLGILTRKPKNTEKVEPHDLEIEGAFVKLPSTFWIANPGNSYVGNASAGSEGSGFWMVSVASSIIGNPAQPPYKTPMGAFDDNRAHTNSFSNFAIDGGLYQDANNDSIYFTGGHYRPETPSGQQFIPQINGFTGFKCASRNVWMRANTMDFNECVLADSRILTLFAYNQRLHNSCLVGRSGNNSGNLPIAIGYPVYDGPAFFDNCHFTNFTGNSFCIRPNGAAQKSTVHHLSGVTFDASTPVDNRVKFDFLTYYDHMLTTGLWDDDGSLTGTAGTHLAAEITAYPGAPVHRLFEKDFNHAPTDVYNADFEAYLGTTHEYGLQRLDFISSTQSPPAIYSIRSDGPAVYTYSPKMNKFQTPVIVNDVYEYHSQFHQIPNRVDHTLRFTQPGDELVSVFTNMPSTTTVQNSSGSPIAPAASLTALRSQSSSGWYFEGNTLYLKQYSGTAGTSTQWQFGSAYPGYSFLRVCPDGCSNPAGIIDHMTLADCEFPSDPRMVVQGSVGGSGLSFDPGAVPGDAVDNKVSWTINSDGDGVNEYRQLRIAFPRQVWNEFKTLQLNYSGPDITVYVHDATDGYTNLGSYSAGAAVNIPLTLGQDPANYHRFDEVDWILLRIFESSIGGVNAVTSGTMNLYGAFLHDAVLTPKRDLEPLVSNLEEEGGLSVSPNPSNGIFNLQGQLTEDVQVNLQVVDLYGRIVLSREEAAPAGEWQSALDLGVAGLASGTYQLLLQMSDGKSFRQKLVLRR